MATAKDFCQTWIFFEASGATTAHEAYPLGGSVTIGQQGTAGNRFMLAWADLHDVLHVLTDLTLGDDGALAGKATDLSSGDPWIVEIRLSEGLQRIQATLASTIIEGNLTGAWGAEAPPHA